jgi:hypothetical protein
MMGGAGMLGRVLRLIVGIMILGLYGALPAPWRYLALIGLLPIGTAFTGLSPIRTALRRSRP